MRPERLVQYSLTLADGQRPSLVWQFDASVRTLREHNRRIPVVVFLYGARPRSSPRSAGARVAVHEQGPYERRLAELCPDGWPALARYPLLHRS